MSPRADAPGHPVAAAASPPAWRNVAGLLGAVAATIAIAWPHAWRFPFALDDYPMLFEAAGLDPGHFDLRRLLSRDVYFRLAAAVFGLRPWAWHAVSLLLHALAALATAALARRLGASRRAAALAAVLFAASPVAYTVVHWISGVQELLATVAAGAMLLVGLRHDRARWLAVPLYGAALLCKESMLGAPLLLVLLQPGRRALPVALACLGLGAAAFAAMGLSAAVRDTSAASPYAVAWDATLWRNLATLWVWTLTPWRAYPDRVAAADPRLVPWALPAFAVVLGLAAWLGGRRGIGHALRAAAAFVILVAPVLPLRAHLYAYYAYAAQAGVLILGAAAVDRLGRRLPQAWAALPALLAAAAFAVMAARTTRTHETLLLPGGPVPHDAVVRYGRVAEDLVRQVRAQHLPAHKTRLVFFSMPAAAFVARTPTPGDVPPNAVRHRIVPAEVALYDGKLIALYFPGCTGRFVRTITPADATSETAFFLVTGLATLEPVADAAEALAILAQGAMLQGNWEEAARFAERALAIDPDHPTARIVLAGARLRLGEPERAAALLDRLDTETLPPPLRALAARVRADIEAARRPPARAPDVPSP